MWVLNRAAFSAGKIYRLDGEVDILRLFTDVGITLNVQMDMRLPVSLLLSKLLLTIFIADTWDLRSIFSTAWGSLNGYFLHKCCSL